jgi:hypothetical protein
MKQKLTDAGIQIYLAKLSSLSGDNFHMLSPWQRKFITDVFEKFIEKPELTKKQMDQIDSIFTQIEGRL